MNKFVIVSSIVIGLVSAAALAEDSKYPGTAPGTLSNTDYADKNGDGCLTPDELKPDSQLAKRFSTRDKNKDGKICKDEYYFQ